ncbi:universal stress protein family protein [Actinomadura pelletieri DSM 43383]|uniref:Universal stress protein family protein n=1 Tax=Actinomadura pelletieri DSM 43383 TaxID=1120940 RepID=A0A495QGL8_9ACTN|nr:universal stress protein [Actinomadura pelletieri]RKS71025.1 universal stress protein family protein [Actinomadura pelletieri DSM 43383]
MRIMPEHRSVVVGVDGSPNSMAALRRAAREAVERHARLDVVRVLETDGATGIRLLPTAREWLRLRRLVAHTIPRAQHLGTRLRIVHGTPGRALADAAEHAELLVVGARAHSEYGNPLGGDTVPVVREHARCALLVCADHTAASQVG